MLATQNSGGGNRRVFFPRYEAGARENMTYYTRSEHTKSHLLSHTHFGIETPHINFEFWQSEFSARDFNCIAQLFLAIIIGKCKLAKSMPTVELSDMRHVCFKLISKIGATRINQSTYTILRSGIRSLRMASFCSRANTCDLNLLRCFWFFKRTFFQLPATLIDIV